MNFYLNPNGRVSRAQFWWRFILPMSVLGFAASTADAAIYGSGASADALLRQAMLGDGDPFAALSAQPAVTLGSVVALLCIWPSIAVTTKRFHDRGMSGWWILWFALIILGGLAFAAVSGASALAAGETPGVAVLIGAIAAGGGGLAQFVILSWMDGRDGPNRFGPDPRDAKPARQDSKQETKDVPSEWAQELIDGDRIASVMAGVRTPDVATPLPPAPARAAREAASGGKPAFGRRGL